MASLNEGRQSEGSDGRGRCVAGDRDRRKAAVEVEPLVEAEVKILARAEIWSENVGRESHLGAMATKEEKARSSAGSAYCTRPELL
jgi:hypothetical protein